MWPGILFSDEQAFCAPASHGQQRVRRKSFTRSCSGVFFKCPLIRCLRSLLYCTCAPTLNVFPKYTVYPQTLLLWTQKLWNSHRLSISFLTSLSLLGLEEKLDGMTQLKVKGLVLGPLHSVQEDEPATLELDKISPIFGSLKQLEAVLAKAHKKGRSSKL